MKPTTKSAAESLDTATLPSSAEYLQYMQEHRQSPGANANLFLAADEKMVRIKEIVEQIKDASVPVLITGESGTGKEVIARAIHAVSNRCNEPFVAVNCAALPPNLLESELFGHEKGAFTGAHQRHIGKFELASNGTLLLDEVTEMDTALQAKLLRALQEKEIERVGGAGPIAVKTRIIATTNRDLAQAVAAGQFRQDLYYRLHVIQLEVPPLRARPADIDQLAWHFLRQYCEQFGRETLELTTDARARLRSHPWPGNVRELQNVIQRAVLLTTGRELTGASLPLETEDQKSVGDWISYLPIGKPLRDLETHFILETLKHHQGNRTHAARTLGISLRTLRNKINEFTAEGITVMAPAAGRMA